MGGGEQGGISPEAAAAEIERAAGQVRRRARWPGLMWLACAVVMFGFFLGTGSGNVWLNDVLGPIPLLAAGALYLFAARQPVVSDRGRRDDKLLSYAFLGTVAVATAIKLAVLPERFTGWLVLIAALAIVPALIGAGRWLRS